MVLCSCKPTGARIVLKHQRLVHLFFLSALLVLSGCSLQPSDAASGSGDQSGSDQSATSDQEAIVCQCPNDSPSDDFMLGLQALSQIDYAAAGQHFEEHALSGGEQAAEEAAVLRQGSPLVHPCACSLVDARAARPEQPPGWAWCSTGESWGAAPCVGSVRS